jgi:hypothetical protein
MAARHLEMRQHGVACAEPQRGHDPRFVKPKLPYTAHKHIGLHGPKLARVLDGVGIAEVV